MSQIELSFESEVGASPQEAWEWIISVDGISQELSPYLRMTTPAGVEGINSVEIVLGQPLFRSRVLLFGFFPIDYTDLTIIELNEGKGFIEQSPTGSMKLWRHERRISPRHNGCVVTDHLTFQPKWAPKIVGWFIRTVFMHRHKILSRNLGAIAR